MKHALQDFIKLDDVWALYNVVQDVPNWEVDEVEIFVCTIIFICFLYVARLYVVMIVKIFDILIYVCGFVIICCVTWALRFYAVACFNDLDQCRDSGGLIVDSLRDRIHTIFNMHK